MGQLLAHPPARVRADEALRPWVRRAEQVITDRLADAAAHAQLGQAFEAKQRIEELRRELLDGDGGSLLADARAAFYRDGFEVSPFDSGMHREIGPDAEGELAARFSQIAGRNQYHDVRLQIEEAAGGLRGLASVRAVVGDSKPPEHWRAQYDSWHRRHTGAIAGSMRQALSDAQMALYSAVGRIRIKPELL
jgi:hypothetical protein